MARYQVISLEQNEKKQNCLLLSDKNTKDTFMIYIVDNHKSTRAKEDSLQLSS